MRLQGKSRFGGANASQGWKQAVNWSESSGSIGESACSGSSSGVMFYIFIIYVQIIIIDQGLNLLSSAERHYFHFNVEPLRNMKLEIINDY